MDRNVQHGEFAVEPVQAHQVDLDQREQVAEAHRAGQQQPRGPRRTRLEGMDRAKHSQGTGHRGDGQLQHHPGSLLPSFEPASSTPTTAEGNIRPYSPM